MGQLCSLALLGGGTATLIRIRELESWVTGLDPTLFSKNFPSGPLMANTGMVAGALIFWLARSKISTATAPMALQLAAIWPNSVGAGVCAESTKQICPFTAGGTSVGRAAPSGTKTKCATIGALISAGVGLAFEVDDQTAFMGGSGG